MILARLKEETRPYHEALEGRVNLSERARTRDGYRGLLARFFGIHDPFEAMLGRFDWSAVGLDYERRRKVPLLRADLRSLGLDDAEVEALPRCASLPRPTDLAGAFGCLYVLEGSTLGGQYVARHVRETLGLDDGLRFFRSYGAEVGPMWKAFGAALSGFAATEPVEDVVVQNACATFRAFHDWLGGTGPLPSESGA